MGAKTRIGAALATAALTLGTAAPAVAQQRIVHDKAGDGSAGTDAGHGPWGDIGRVRVTHAPLRLRVKIFPAPSGQLSDFIEVWVDTDPADPGPEFVVTHSPQEDETWVGVTTAERFGHFGGKRRCATHTGHISLRHQTAWFSVRRYCLRDAAGVAPSRLRVSVHTFLEYESADWAPARRKWSRWIHRG